MGKELNDAFCTTCGWVFMAMVLIGIIVTVIPWLWDKTSLQRYILGERIRLEIALMRIKEYENACRKADRLERKYRKAVRYLDSRPWNRGARW